MNSETHGMIEDGYLDISDRTGFDNGFTGAISHEGGSMADEWPNVIHGSGCG